MDIFPLPAGLRAGREEQLIFAAGGGATEVVRMLIEEQADVNTLDIQGFARSVQRGNSNRVSDVKRLFSVFHKRGKSCGQKVSWILLLFGACP